MGSDTNKFFLFVTHNQCMSLYMASSFLIHDSVLQAVVRRATLYTARKAEGEVGSRWFDDMTILLSNDEAQDNQEQIPLRHNTVYSAGVSFGTELKRRDWRSLDVLRGGETKRVLEMWRWIQAAGERMEDRWSEGRQAYNGRDRGGRRRQDRRRFSSALEERQEEHRLTCVIN